MISWGEKNGIFLWNFCHQFWWKWEWFTKIVVKNFTKFGENFRESPNLVTNLSPPTLGLLYENFIKSLPYAAVSNNSCASMEIVKNQTSARMKKLCMSFIHLILSLKLQLSHPIIPPFLAIIIQQNDIWEHKISTWPKMCFVHHHC